MELYTTPATVQTIELYPSTDVTEASTDDGPELPARRYTARLPESLRVPQVLLLQGSDDHHGEASVDFEDDVSYEDEVDDHDWGYEQHEADYEEGYDIGELYRERDEQVIDPNVDLNASLLAAVQAHPQYEGSISRREAATLLADRPVGGYLLRYSEHTQQGVLSIRIAGGQQHHLLKASVAGVLFNGQPLPNCHNLKDALQLLADPQAVQPFMRQAILLDSTSDVGSIAAGSRHGSYTHHSSGSLGSRRGSYVRSSSRQPPSAGALTAQSWYHGAIDRADAESRLGEQLAEPVFLVRRRGDGSYALSLRVAEAYSHHLLEGDSSGVLLNGEAMVPACATVQAAVELLQQHGQGAVPTLGQGVSHPEEGIHRL